jgi:CIC family chloride channel protein
LSTKDHGAKRGTSLRRLWIRLLSLGGNPLGAGHTLREKEELFLRQILLAGILGVATGGLVAVFDFLLRDQAVWYLYNLDSSWMYLLLPVAGILLSALVTRTLVPSREGKLTEDYILVYHDRSRHMRIANLPGKMLASFLTIAMGGSMGLEGPSIYMGSTLGDWLQRRFNKLFSREDRKLLLVAGASAGMAAIFKAPLTGLVFSMEAPYKDSMASRALVPAMIASSTSYITYVLLVGSEPIFAQHENSRFEAEDILYAMLLGLCCGLGARLFLWLMRTARRLLDLIGNAWAGAAFAGLVVGGLGMTVFQVFGEPFIYGPGYHLIRHLLAFGNPLALLLLLLTAKMVATAFTAAGGGVGGLFFPMAVMGVIMGSAFVHLLPPTWGSLYPLIGLAAFVAAGYRTPLAAVAFVAETTGNPWILIPAMLASVTSFLTMGSQSISEHQANRTGEFGG